MNPHGLLAFCEDRISRGRMEPQALGRFARLFRDADRGWITSFAPASPACERPRLSSTKVSFGRAAAFVALWHRHLGPPVGHLFSRGVFHEHRLCGAAIAGRPVARMLDNGKTIEITRVATDGTRNACSKILAEVCREARRRGYRRVVTYTLKSESGASLRAAGFVREGPAGGGRWSRKGRTRADRHPLDSKIRWSFYLRPRDGRDARKALRDKKDAEDKGYITCAETFENSLDGPMSNLPHDA